MIENKFSHRLLLLSVCQKFLNSSNEAEISEVPSGCLKSIVSHDHLKNITVNF